MMMWFSAALLEAQRLALVVVERQTHAGDVGKVGRDVAVGDLDEAVLHVLGVDELDLVEDPQLLQQGGADQPVEVAAGDEAALLGGACAAIGARLLSRGRSGTRRQIRAQS